MGERGRKAPARANLWLDLAGKAGALGSRFAPPRNVRAERGKLRPMPLFLGSHWWPLWVFPLLTALGLGGVWMWRGRDDRARVPLPPNPFPPLELSPAQVATLVDNSCDLRDIVATLIDLAARGYLSIEEAAPDALMLAPDDLCFVRCSDGPPIERLKKHERMFLAALFDPQPPDPYRGQRAANSNPSNEPWNETALSLLQNKFYRHLPDLEAEIYASLEKEGYFFADPKATRAFFLVTGAILIFGSSWVLGRSGEWMWTSGFASLFFGIMLSGALWMIAAPFMPAKTALGTLKADQANRFIEWVRTVPPPMLRAKFEKNPDLFERLLPYALVLGVGEIWARKGDECGQWAPLWFCSSAPDAQSAPGAIAHLLAHLPRIEKTFASAPPPRSIPRDDHGHNTEIGNF